MPENPKDKIPTKSEKKTTVSNSVRLDSKNPIPIEQNGMGFYTKRGGRYVPFLDGQDNYPSILLEAKLLSPTTLSCINSKVTFCVGNGYKLKDVEKDLVFDKWAKVINKKGQSFNEVSKSCFDNYFSFGNVFADVVRFKVGTTPYIKVFIKSILDCRLNVPVLDDVSDTVFVSKEFRRMGIWGLKETQYMPIPIYTGDTDQKWYTDTKGYEHAIIYLKNDVSGFEFYGLPSNVASLPEQILEYKYKRYELDNLENNLVVGGVIILQASLTQEEANKMGSKIVQQHSGDGKRGKYVILSSETGIENSKVESFDRQKDGDFIEADIRTEEKLILANDWSKSLMDPQSKGIGNTSKQIKEIYEVKKKFVIEPAQAFIIEKFVMPLMAICDDWMGTKWSLHEFGFDTNSPVSFAGELDINSILTVDEGRDLIGKLPLGGTIGNAIIAPAIQKPLKEGSANNV